MTLQINISPSQEARLAAEAEQQGLEPGELVQRLLAEHFAELPAPDGAARFGGEARSQRVTQVRSIRGKYAHLGVTTDDLHRERRADKQREAL